jgi:hypothetical protein
MDFRHAAALALLVVYLMVPPLDPSDPEGVNASAPLGRWLLLGTFDSATDCENDKVNLIGQNYRLGEKEKATRVLLGHCIASDDPRLKQ